MRPKVTDPMIDSPEVSASIGIAPMVAHFTTGGFTRGERAVCTLQIDRVELIRRHATGEKRVLDRPDHECFGIKDAWTGELLDISDMRPALRSLFVRVMLCVECDYST